MGKLEYYIYLLAAILLVGCKEPFEPNLPIVPQGYLVVEGFINAQGPTQIKLSRTVPINEKKTLKPELNATIRVEGDDNSSFNLATTANGIYTSNTLPISPQKKYRLYIKTKSGSEYRSDYVPVKISPSIDSINWKLEEDKVAIYANTHDPSNNTIYYRWDYDETWEIHSPHVATVKVDNGTIRNLTPADTNVSVCWKYDTSSTIILGSSAKLENDIIHLNPIVSSLRTDEKFGVRYSIVVRQYAINKEAYNFFDQMRKSTETLGSIFDPQPTLLKSNIHSLSNPDELVIGYIYSTTVQQQRIFISRAQLPSTTIRSVECVYFTIAQTSKPGFVCCTIDSLNIEKTFQAYPQRLPFNPLYSLFGILIGYETSSNYCVDCRLRGGSVIKPSFW